VAIITPGAAYARWREVFEDQVRGWLDKVLYRRPFEGASARRYATAERPAFAGLDDRLLDCLAPALVDARRLLDLGCGPRTFAARAAERFPHVAVIAIDPSRDFARRDGGLCVVRAAGESLPIADGSIDAAMCLSSIRHVRDRGATLAELRRVVRGTALIVELDPRADARRVAVHAGRLGSRLLRHAFGPLVVRTAPEADEIAELARAAGWTLRERRDDPDQPVYILELA
jgi:ubiquinone/menaquinone biosynthesis C-methylase UbiE